MTTVLWSDELMLAISLSVRSHWPGVQPDGTVIVS